MPDPDLLIRTSGEMRVSNFLLWQIAYAELYVTETLVAGLHAHRTAGSDSRLSEARPALRRLGLQTFKHGSGERPGAMKRIATALVLIPMSLDRSRRPLLGLRRRFWRSSVDWRFTNSIRLPQRRVSREAGIPGMAGGTGSAVRAGAAAGAGDDGSGWR